MGRGLETGEAKRREEKGKGEWRAHVFSPSWLSLLISIICFKKDTPQLLKLIHFFSIILART